MSKPEITDREAGLVIAALLYASVQPGEKSLEFFELAAKFLGGKEQLMKMLDRSVNGDEAQQRAMAIMNDAAREQK